MNANLLKQILLGVLGLGASGIALSFGFQSFIGIRAFFISDYSAYEQGRLGLLLLVSMGIFIFSAWVTFWTFRKMSKSLLN